MTTVLSPIDLAHLVQVVSHQDCGYRAECGCGWASAWVDSQSDAHDAATDHREVAVGPPTGLDAALSGLLDLQDDLADTVMWLAENWSADLPTPYVYSRDHQRANGERVAGVVLLVYCAADTELARVAGLLAAPVLADAEPNRYGPRWERAVRHFGRVRIDAYRSLDDEDTP